MTNKTNQTDSSEPHRQTRQAALESNTPAPETTSSHDMAPAAPEKTRGSHILLAEDDPIARTVLELLFKRSHYRLDIAEDGQTVVDMWEKGDYALVLMDVQMPRINGFDATRAIRERERERGGHVLIVAMTAHAGREDEEKCLAAGMDAHIPKPIDFKKCLQVIEELLSGNSGDVSTKQNVM